MKGERIELRPPVAPMLARPAPRLPDEDHARALLFEPKLDGWRCLAFHRVGGRVELRSRRDKALGAYFPEIVAGVRDRFRPGPSSTANLSCTATAGATSPRCSSASAGVGA